MKLYTSGPARQMLDVYHTGDWRHFKSGKPVFFTAQPCATLEDRFGQVSVDVPDTFDVDQYLVTMADGAKYYVLPSVPHTWTRELVNVEVRPLSGSVRRVLVGQLVEVRKLNPPVWDEDQPRRDACAVELHPAAVFNPWFNMTACQCGAHWYAGNAK